MFHLRCAEPAGIVTVLTLLLLCLLLQVYGLIIPGRIAPGREHPSRDEDEDVEFQLEIVKRSILDSLGMAKVPDVRKVNTSKEEIRHMMKVFKRSIEFSQEQEAYEEEQEAKKFRSAVKFFYSFEPQGRLCLLNLC